MQNLSSRAGVAATLATSAGKFAQKLVCRKPATFWLTGLSGAGKSTLAAAVIAALDERGILSFNLDGDSLREGLSKGLGFSDADRHENIRRAAETCRLLNDAGVVVVASFISPLQKMRAQARDIVGAGSFFEVFVKCPLEVCEKRDIKGLYKRARENALASFTGVSAVYEEPAHPNFVVSTAAQDVRGSAARLQEFALEKIGLEA